MQLVLTPLIHKQLFLFSLDVVYLLLFETCVSITLEKFLKKHLRKKHGKKLLAIVSLNKVDGHGWEWMGARFSTTHNKMIFSHAHSTYMLKLFFVG